MNIKREVKVMFSEKSFCAKSAPQKEKGTPLKFGQSFLGLIPKEDVCMLLRICRQVFNKKIHLLVNEFRLEEATFQLKL